MVWLKSIHIATLLVWCAGLLYLPPLFAAHAGRNDPSAFQRLRKMTRLSYIGVTSPAGVLAIASGTALIPLTAPHGGWLYLKLTAVALMVAFHVHCGRVLARLWETPAYRRPATHLASLTAPAALIGGVLWLVLARPLA